MAGSYLIVHNPTAGRRRVEIVEAVADRLKASGADVAFYPTTGPGAAVEFLRGLEELPDVVVAAGGDGTVNEVANGLKGHSSSAAGRVRLGILPVGTTNVLAKELGLPTEPEALAKVLLGDETRSVYPNQLNGQRFLLMVGVGFDAWVVNGVSLPLKKRIGKAAYALEGFRQAPRYGRSRYELLVDGAPYEAHSVIVTSGRFYGGRFLLSRSADLAKPTLQAVIFHSRTALGLSRDLLMLGLRSLEDSPGVESVEGRKIVIRPAESPGVERSEAEGLKKRVAERVQIDGDPGGSLPVELDVEAEPLEILCSS